MAVKPDDARVVGAGGGTPAGRDAPRPSQREDAALVAALRNGEPAAFATLVTDYQSAVFNLALRLVRDREDARDITQDVLIKAHGSVPDTVGELHLWAWLYRVTVNTCWDHLRAAGRRPRPTEDAEELAATRADDQEERAEVARLFSQSLAALPPRQQAALVLKDIHGLDHAEIAEALGITRGSSKVLLFHARHSFRHAYRALTAVDPRPAACRLAENAVAASVGGRLSAAQRRALLKHARSCADCRSIVARWERPHAGALALALPLVATPHLFSSSASGPLAAGPALAGASASTAAGASAGAGASAATGASAGAGAAAAASAAATSAAATSGAAASIAGGLGAKLAGLGAAKVAAVVVAATSLAAYSGAETYSDHASRPAQHTPAAAATLHPAGAVQRAAAGSHRAETGAAGAATAAARAAGREQPPGPAVAPVWPKWRRAAMRAAAAAGAWPAAGRWTALGRRLLRPAKDRPLWRLAGLSRGRVARQVARDSARLRSRLEARAAAAAARWAAAGGRSPGDARAAATGPATSGTRAGAAAAGTRPAASTRVAAATRSGGATFTWRPPRSAAAATGRSGAGHDARLLTPAGRTGSAPARAAKLALKALPAAALANTRGLHTRAHKPPPRKPDASGAASARPAAPPPDRLERPAKPARPPRPEETQEP